MNGLLRRLTRRRAATADEHPPDAPAASEPVAATPPAAEEASGENAGVDGPTGVDRAYQVSARRNLDLPAGVDETELEASEPTTATRARLRRRVRYLQRVRELLL